MNTHDEFGLRDTYQRFDRDHARLREELLEKLRAAPAGSLTAPRRQSEVSWRLGRWVIGLAASILLAAALWAALVRSPRAAYGVADIPDRLSACQSVLVDGWREVAGMRYPWRSYVKRGSYLWSTTLAAENEKVFIGYSASDSKHYVVVSDRDHTAVFGKEDPLAFELMTCCFLQIGLPGQLLGADGGGFTKTGVSKVSGVRVDVYEKREPGGLREVVWLNGSSGVPVRSAFFEPGPDGRERQSAQIDVTTDVLPPQTMPPIDPPAGYALLHRDREPQEALSGAGVGVNGVILQALLVLNLDDRAVLLCWRHFDDSNRAAPDPDVGGPVGLQQPLEIRSPDGKRKYLALHLHDDPRSDGHYVRWSLLVPEDGGLVGRGEMTISRPKGTARLNLMPLRFERPELARLVVESQKLTLPASSTPMGVDQLEALYGRHK